MNLSQHLTDNDIMLVQIIALCLQAESLYMIHYRPRSLTSYGISGNHRVKINTPIKSKNRNWNHRKAYNTQGAILMILNHTTVTKNISVILIDLISKRINHSFNPLTYWPWHKIVDILQMTYSNAISWTKTIVFQFEFHGIPMMAQLTDT